MVDWPSNQPTRRRRRAVERPIRYPAMTLDDAFNKLRAASEPAPQPLRLPTAAEVDAAERDLGVRFRWVTIAGGGTGDGER